MPGNDMVGSYGLLRVVLMNVTLSHSNEPEVESLLLKTKEHLQAAEESLKAILMFRPAMEE